MSMSKKDFQLVATAVSHLELGDSTHVFIASMLADALETENPRFDREKFILACQRRAFQAGAKADPNGFKLFVADVESSADARRTLLKAALTR